ncbi:MAG: hypothetical protein RBS77_05600 [Candidatus Moranbacteria bacterium]|nr:hypothetical protein [Candidatus Moranbacteria bacterium]
MGRLVGGAIKSTVTGSGSEYFAGKNTNYSSDCHTQYTGTDIINGDFDTMTYWSGANDVTAANVYALANQK